MTLTPKEKNWSRRLNKSNKKVLDAERKRTQDILMQYQGEIEAMETDPFKVGALAAILDIKRRLK